MDRKNNRRMSPSKNAFLRAIRNCSPGQVWALTHAVCVFYVSLMSIRSSADKTLLVKSVVTNSSLPISDLPAWPIGQKPAIASHQKPSQARAKEVA